MHHIVITVISKTVAGVVVKQEDTIIAKSKWAFVLSFWLKHANDAHSAMVSTRPSSDATEC